MNRDPGASACTAKPQVTVHAPILEQYRVSGTHATETRFSGVRLRAAAAAVPVRSAAGTPGAPVVAGSGLQFPLDHRDQVRMLAQPAQEVGGKPELTVRPATTGWVIPSACARAPSRWYEGGRSARSDSAGVRNVPSATGSHAAVAAASPMPDRARSRLASANSCR